MSASQVHGPDEVFESVQEIFRVVFKDPQLMLDRSLKAGAHPSWDSFSNVEILMKCEAFWGIQFSTNQIDRMLDVGALVDEIVSSTSS